MNVLIVNDRRLETYRLQQRLREQAQRRLLYGDDVDAADGVVHYNGAADDDDDDDALFRQMDAVDCVIEMQGHIIGTRLSPDGRRVTHALHVYARRRTTAVFRSTPYSRMFVLPHFPNVIFSPRVCDPSETNRTVSFSFN